MDARKTRTHTALSLVLAVAVLVGGLLPAVALAAEPASPYTPEEFAVITGGATTPGSIDIYGDWVAYQPYDFGGGKAYRVRNVRSGAEITFEGTYFSGQRSLALWEDTVAWIIGYGPSQVELYNVNTGDRRTVVDSENQITVVDLRAGTLVWMEYVTAASRIEIRALDLESDQVHEVAVGPEYKLNPRVWGDLVVWEQAQEAGQQRDIYGYRLSEGEVFPVSANPWVEYNPVLYEETVVWVDTRATATSGTDIYALNLDTGEETAVCTEAADQDSPAIWGDLVVWADGRNLDGLSGVDIYAYDLKRQVEFAVTRHIGLQREPAVFEDLVLWQDWRHAPQVKYATGEMYGARLLDKPLAEPLAVTGAPEAFDGLIEVVWPHSGQPGTDTDMVNIGAYLFTPPGTKRAVPCRFDPPLELWVAENNRPAEMVARITQRSYNWSPSTWHFNDVDTRWARNPNNQLYFFLGTEEGLDFRSNVWAHAADARTFRPQQTPVRSAQGQVPTEVDAVIQIVWPHGNLPVVEATKVNISANLFAPGTDISVPASWEPEVMLYRSLNNGVSEAVTTGVKRLVTEGSLVYPVWDFNDVDVSEARDPQNKYYFRLEVDGVVTHSTVWSHGADARTYFPEVDVPECQCDQCP
ncbi:MAG: hypothetical protein GXX93_13145 [Anaerolineae bacterium]|nr:hypothetical protein [Anaerolineae bacterium]